MSTQDKLAEALRMARDYVSDVAYDGNTVARKNVQLIDEVLQAHAAEAAQIKSEPFTGFRDGKCGDLVVDREALHASPGYKRQIAALDELRNVQAQAQSGEWVWRKRKGHTEWRQGTEKDGGGSTNYVEPVWVWDEPELFDQWMDRDWPLWRNDPDNPNVARLRRMYDMLAAAPQAQKESK